MEYKTYGETGTLKITTNKSSKNLLGNLSKHRDKVEMNEKKS